MSKRGVIDGGIGGKDHRRQGRGLSTAPGRELAAVLLSTLLLTACTQQAGQTLPAGASALHRAIAAGQLSRARELTTKDVNVRGRHGWTPLHLCAIYGADEIARELIKRGATVDALDATQMTPLHWAARRGQLGMAQLLLAHRASVKARNKFDMTPLHEARTQKLAALLLSRGADIHARDVDGMTPLHRAPTRRVAQFLIGKGASTQARAKDGRTPLNMPPTVRPRTRQP